MLLGCLAEGGELADARIGDQNIDSPLCPADILVQTIQVSHTGDIPLDASDVVADRLHRLIELSLPASGNEEIGPFFGEELRDGQAYPFRPSRDERHSSWQLAHATSRPIDRSVRRAPSYSLYLPRAGDPGQETADAATRSRHPRPRA